MKLITVFNCRECPYRSIYEDEMFDIDVCSKLSEEDMLKDKYMMKNFDVIPRWCPLKTESICDKCIKECKQEEGVKIIACPKFKRIVDDNSDKTIIEKK